ncbi:ferredoxin [Nocardia sp. NPDC006630]|uniref:ferredoxin n=1 Tax=Nocardia sp. NPDC006630 TaxID=3157181 RepID=UPI0033BEAB79
MTHPDSGDRDWELHIDWTRCAARGLCSDLLPETLSRDDWGYPISRDGRRRPRLAAAQTAAARDAVELCPRLALRLLPPHRD